MHMLYNQSHKPQLAVGNILFVICSSKACTKKGYRKYKDQQRISHNLKSHARAYKQDRIIYFSWYALWLMPLVRSRDVFPDTSTPGSHIAYFRRSVRRSAITQERSNLHNTGGCVCFVTLSGRPTELAPELFASVVEGGNWIESILQPNPMQQLFAAEI